MCVNIVQLLSGASISLSVFCKWVSASLKEANKNIQMMEMTGKIDKLHETIFYYNFLFCFQFSSCS